MTDSSAAVAAAAQAYDDPSDSRRAALRQALEPILEQAQHDLRLARAQLSGPDPESALVTLAQALADLGRIPSVLP